MRNPAYGGVVLRVCRVEFRWPDDLLARVDAARGDVTRSLWSLWLRRAAEQALDDAGVVGTLRPAGRSCDDAPAPAEQPAPLSPEEPVRSPKPDFSQSRELQGLKNLLGRMRFGGLLSDE